MQVHFKIVDLPSRSKGWGRIKAASNARPVIQSSTGNEWVSADKIAELEPGTEVVLTIQEQIAHGKGRTLRRDTDIYDTRLIVEPGATAMAYGSYTKVRVVGAREAA